MAKEYESKLYGLDSSPSDIPASAFDPGGAFAATIQGPSAAELAPMATQDSQIFNQYFQPLYDKYGLNQQGLVSAYQSGGLGQTGDNMLVNEQNYKNTIINPNTWLDTLAQQLALAGTVGLATAGIGAYLGPALGAALGSTSGAIATGAISGAAGGAFSDTLTEGGKNIGSATGKGALSGAVGGAVAPASAALSNSTGLNSTVSTGLVKTAAGAGTSAAGAALTGGNVGSAASSGALNSAAGAAGGAIEGSVFSNGSTINPSITNQNNPMGTSSSTSDFGYDPTTLGDIDQSTYDAYDPSGAAEGFGFDPSTLGNIDPSTLDALNGSSGDMNAQYQQLLGLQSGAGGASTGSSGLLSGLLKLLGGSSGGGAAGGSSSLLSSLLGGGLNTAAGALNSSAAKSAASTYAGQTAYNPYSVTTSQGTAGFDGTNAFSALSPQAQQTNNGLNALTQQSTGSLLAGQGAASQNYYNQLQASQSDANNKMYQNNLDSQFGKGILSSTAGQYQSQAALNNISQQGLNDQVLANQFGQTQQQQQLAQLTSGLNGLNSSQSSQLQQIQAGGQLGSNAGNVNLNAYKPEVAANANSTFGGILGSLGSTGSSNGIAQLLQALGGS